MASSGEPAHREERSERDREESMDGREAVRGNERERRPRKQVSWRARRPTAGRRPRSLTQILQTTVQTPSILCPFYHPVQLHSATLLFFMVLLSSLHYRSSAFAPSRGKHRGVWKILTSEASSPRSLACMAPKTTRVGVRKKREGETSRDNYRENPMT